MTFVRDPERPYVRVDAEGCWVWARCQRGKSGYGCVCGPDGKTHYAHRFTYEAAFGPVPAGLQIDHLCRNRMCCNPAHLEAVTQRENILRGVSPNILAHQTGICRRGHTMTAENVIEQPNGTRTCRTCARWREKNRPPATPEQRVAARASERRYRENRAAKRETAT